MRKLVEQTSTAESARLLDSLLSTREREEQLPGVARARIEAAFGARLGSIRIHDSAATHAACAALGVDAFTTGADIYFGAARYSVGDDRGLRLIAHEVAHVLQQAQLERGSNLPAGARRVLEAEADAQAELAVRGVSGPRRGITLATETSDRTWVQAHGSWEHSLFGDATVQELTAIAANAPDQARRVQILAQFRDLLSNWQTKPGSVTADRLTAIRPGTRFFQHSSNKVMFSYGELNALPDYVSSATAIGLMPAQMLRSILQSIRQESFNKIQGMIGPKGTTPIIGGPTALLQAWAASAPVDFAEAASPAIRFATANLLLETLALDNLTKPLATNRYMGLVARNACHFAPYSWYRWRDSFARAQSLARNAHDAKNMADRALLEFQAWMHAGYAAHFLQDSFAAGHLVNKTLVMQWFVDWASDWSHMWGPVLDWSVLTTMTAARQPGIAARSLYEPGSNFEAFNPAVRDPQTAEDQTSKQDRMALTGVRAEGSISQAQAYQNFLIFMSNPAAQSAAGALHDHFNSASLFVASQAHPSPFQIWGDDTMLLGGDGIEIASTATHMSQQSIAELLETGRTDFTINSIFAHIPTRVALPSGRMVGLEDWQFSDEIRAVANSVFPSAHYYVAQVGGRFAGVSLDL